jgi:hypothetical protein
MPYAIRQDLTITQLAGARWAAAALLGSGILASHEITHILEILDRIDRMVSARWEPSGSACPEPTATSTP